MALLFFVCTSAGAQEYIIGNGDTLEVSLCESTTATVYDDGGATGNYSNHFDGWVVLNGDVGSTLRLTGTYETEQCCDYIRIWDGDNPVYQEFRGVGTIDLTLASHWATIYFHTDGSVEGGGFAIEYESIGGGGSCVANVSGLTVGGITSSGATVAWTGVGGPFQVVLNGQPIGATSNTSYTLSGLNAASQHTVLVYPEGESPTSCCADRASFRTACGTMRLPLTENFNDVAVDSMPPCWLRSVNFDEVSAWPRVLSLGGRSRAQMLSCGDNSTGGHYGLVASPLVGSDVSEWRVSFEVRPSHSGVWLVLGTCDSTSPEYTLYGFTPLDSIYLTDNERWTTYSSTWTVPSGASRVAFYMVQSRQNGTGRRVYIDNMQAAACGVETAWATRADTVSTQLHWTLYGGPTVDVGVKPMGALLDDTVYVGCTSPMHIEGLRPDMRYTLTLYPHCAGTEGLPKSITVRTLPGNLRHSLCSELENEGDGWHLLRYNDNTNAGSGIADLHPYNYLVSPPMATLGGKMLTFQHWATYSGMQLMVGTMMYQDDSSTFVPLDTVYPEEEFRQYHTYRIPDGVTARHLAFTVAQNTPDYYCLHVRNLQLSDCAIVNPRLVHVYGTRVELAWDSLVGADTVIVEYGPRGFASGSGVRDTLTGTTGATLAGLTPHTQYDIALYTNCDDTLCHNQRLQPNMAYADYPMPYCEDFDAEKYPWRGWRGWWEGDWYFTDGIYNRPQVTHHPYFYRADDALELTSYGFDWGYNSQVTLPNVEFDTGAILSFHAMNMAPQGQLVIGTMPAESWIEQFQPLDTLTLAPRERRHYAYPLPDSLRHLPRDRRLALRYLHQSPYSAYSCFIDELHIAHSAYGNFVVTGVGHDSAAFSIDSLMGRADSVEVSLVGGGATVTDTVAAANLAAFSFDGLDTGTLYLCYVRPLDDGCNSYATYFTTQTASGGGVRWCHTFESLLSYELPDGWTFSDTAWIDGDTLVVHSDTAWVARMPYMGGVGGMVLNMRLANSDTLYIGTHADGRFVPFDTLAPSPTMHYLQQRLPNLADTARLAFACSDTCRLMMAGVTHCPMLHFEADGSDIVCTVEEGHTMNYFLDFWKQGDSLLTERHVIASPYRIIGLEPGETYELTWRCEFDGDDGCRPVMAVTPGERLNIPYCANFDPAHNTSGIPSGWTFHLVDPTTTPYIHAGTNQMTFGQWHESGWDYAVLPPLSQDTALTLTANFYSSRPDGFQIGTLPDGNDTTGFIALYTSGDNTNWQTLDLGIDDLGGRRLALRARGSVDLTQFQLFPFRHARYALIDASTVKVTTDAPSDYWLHLQCHWPNNFDTLIHVQRDRQTLLLGNLFGDYNIYQRADSATTDCQRQFSFRTRSAETTPYCNNLDQYWNYGWQAPENYYVLSDNNYPRMVDQENRTVAIIFQERSDRPQLLVLPDMQVDSVQRLSLYLEYRADNAGDSLQVGVMTDAFDSTSFRPVSTLVFRGNQWKSATIDFAGYADSGRWIALRRLHSADHHRFLVDNLRVETCAAATAAIPGLERHNVVRIDSEQPIADTFYAEYGPHGFTPGNGTLIAVDSLPYRLTLAPNTHYDFYIYCSPAERSCAEVHSVKTLGAPIAVPSCIDFDTMTPAVAPLDWTIHGIASTITDVASHSGTQALEVMHTIASPDIAVDSLQEVALGLWVMAPNSGSRLVVGSMTNLGNPASFHASKTITPRQPGVWEHHYVSFANTPSNAHFIALRNTTAGTPVYVDDMHITDCAAFDMRVNQVTDNNLTLSWSQVGQPDIGLNLVQGSDTTAISLAPQQQSVTIGGITSLSNYKILFHSNCNDGTACALPYADTIVFTAPNEGEGCVDATNLDSGQSVFYSGSYVNPYLRMGADDRGALSADSRHTVCFDTTQRDPRTGGLLRMVPQGASASVRLGNWSTNMDQPEAESIVYSLRVDTLSFNMLMMRYAAVLQDPMHDPSDQPRFRLELLDSTFTLIDPICAAADFIANRSLGWNEAPNNVLWKDWTSVGIDLSEYAGQQVYVRLTTYDCNEGSHYGYAYFTLECSRKTIETTTCGNVAHNSFIAPPGFNYRWHTATSNTTLSTEQTFTAPTSTGETYLCELSFVGNNACTFTLQAYGGTRFPLALLDTIVSVDSCGYNVQFINRSTISSDGTTPTGTGEGVLTTWWDFGNGQTSNAYHTSTSYPHGGNYEVTLVVGIAGGCTDTLRFPLYLSTPSIEGPTHLCLGQSATLTLVDGTTTDPLWTGGSRTVATSPTSTDDSITVEVHATGRTGCDTLLRHTIHLHAPTTSHDTITLCENNFPLLWHGHTITLPPTQLPLTDTLRFDRRADLQSQHGCDSTVFAHIVAVPVPPLFHTPDTTVISGATVLLRAEGADSVVWRLADSTYLGSTHLLAVQPRTTTTYLVEGYSATSQCTVSSSLTITTLCGNQYDTAVCRNYIPFEWNGQTVTDTGTYRLVMSSPLCGDSIVVMHLRIPNTSFTHLVDTLRQNDLATYLPPFGSTPDYTDRTEDPEIVMVKDTSVVLANQEGCDSTVRHTLYLYRNYHVDHHISLCDNKLPLVWEGYTLATDTLLTDTLSSVYGTDSVVTLRLTVRATYDLADTIVVCPYRPYMYEGVDYGGPTQFDSPHLSRHDCDSMVHVVLVPRDTAFRLTVEASMEEEPWHRADTTLLACTPTSLRLRDATHALQHHWTFWSATNTASDTLTGSDSTFATNIDSAGIFSFQLIAVDPYGCLDTMRTDSLLWTFPRPQAAFIWEPARPSMHRPEVQLINQSRPADLTYLWTISTTNGTDTVTEPSPFYQWEGAVSAGDYDVLLAAYWLHHGPDTLTIVCDDSLRQPITIADVFLQFPNLVTPNGDGVNDLWRVVNLLEQGEYPMNELWIYDHWGALVYHVENIRRESDFWDPNDCSCPDATYYFRFVAKNDYGIVRRNGVIEVVR